MRLTASVKAIKAVCAYQRICTYRQYAPNNAKIRYFKLPLTMLL